MTSFFLIGTLISFFFAFGICNFFLLNNLVSCDVSLPYQLLFQDPATEFVEGIIDLHHDVMGYLVFLCAFVAYILSRTVLLFDAKINKRPPVDVRHHTLIEIVWTIIPTAIVMAIAIPSFVLIYAMDEIVNPRLTVKAVGSQ